MEDSKSAQRKTPNIPGTTSISVESYNVLNNYRSYTYNFTIAALHKSDVSDPKKYMNKPLDLIILKSGGKGIVDIKPERVNSADVGRASMDAYDRFDRLVKTESAKKVQQVQNNAAIIEGFKQRSPGRFDMFLEDVSIDAIMAPSEETGLTLATKIEFTVIEPYSINGFIEALQVTSLAAGYPNYLQASFVLKLDFLGYPDSQDFTEPTIVPNSSRYFVFKFTKIEVEVTERGTTYKCMAVPFGETALGLPNKLKTPIGMEGKTVKEILTNLMDGLTKQAAKANKESREAGAAANKSDRYFIKFPTRTENGMNFDLDNEIANYKLVDLQADQKLYKFDNPGNSNANGYTKTSGAKKTDVETVKYNPVTAASKIHFRENARVDDIISSVIRDSAEIRTKLKNIGKNGNPDQYGFVDYFIIKTEIVNQPENDPVTKKPYQDFIFIVMPYKVYYTVIPAHYRQKIDSKKIKTLVNRQYDYLYTGDNVDVLSFKLNFNSLFFEAIPNAMAADDQPAGKHSAVKGYQTVAKIDTDPVSKSAMSPAAPAPTQASSELTSVQSMGGNATLPQDDPYLQLSRAMHSAIVNSKASMMTGEIEIIGDPFYLTTSSNGGRYPANSSTKSMDTGEVDVFSREIVILINFRNPVDIDTLERGGLYYFDDNRVSFSGIYRVLRCNNSFRNGSFTQRLNIVRIPGQTEVGEKPSRPEDAVKTETKSDSGTTAASEPGNISDTPAA